LSKQFVRLLALALALPLVISPTRACAWGVDFTSTARDAALQQVTPDLLSLANPTGDDAIPSVLDETEEIGEAAEQAVNDLAQALRYRQRAEAELALARVVAVATDTWQPLSAAGLLDPEGAAPGFHFRYEVLLAERASSAIGDPRRADPVSDVPALVRAIASERATLVSELAGADARARLATGGLYNESYYAVLWEDLGPDLEHALQGATETAADLIETAWQRAGEPAQGSNASAALALRAMAAGPGLVAVDFFLSSSEPVTATIYNAAGRSVAAVHQGPLPAGFHRLTAELSGHRALAHGIYFVRLQAGRVVAATKLPIVN
jgi:hypothetical protein